MPKTNDNAKEKNSSSFYQLFKEILESLSDLKNDLKTVLKILKEIRNSDSSTSDDAWEKM